MSHIGTHLSPLGGCSTVGKLDEVEGILHVRAEFSKGNHFVAFVLAGQPAAQYRQRLCTEVFTQQEIFVKAKSVTLEIIRESFMLELYSSSDFRSKDGSLPDPRNSSIDNGWQGCCLR